MGVRPWVQVAERACLTALLVWLAWLPLPFGSIIEKARMPLIAVPLLLCSVAAALRYGVVRDRPDRLSLTAPSIVWSAGGFAFLLLCALQLVPLPAAIHQAISPESFAIWARARELASMANVPVRAMAPLSVDPAATALEVLRMGALLATFAVSMILIRSHGRRLAFASVLCATAMFEALYGAREAALQRYEIWGWVNRLIFNRVTGTFVNPNHFAHYVAIVLPMALFLGAVTWRNTGSAEIPRGRRLARLLERHLLPAAFAAVAALACLTAILLGQSRGALFAAGTGLVLVAAMLPVRRAARMTTTAAGVLALVAGLILFLGPERTVRRFTPSPEERDTFVGRKIGIEAAARLWMRFPIVGSGAGTFERVVSLEQKAALDKIFHHAHNDYAEIAATTGTVGFAIAITTLVLGFVSTARVALGADAATLTWRRRAFQIAALGSLGIAMLHALVDFNFFIPANPATLAAIIGAAAAGTSHDIRTRR